MGKVNKKRSGPTKDEKNRTKRAKVEEEPIDGAISDDEEIEDEELSAEESDAESNPEELTTDLEGFPISEDDKEGIINLLTQIFLRNAEVSVPDLTDAIIQNKFGLVVGPAEDEADDDNTNMVYGLLTALEIDKSKEESPKYVSQLVNFITERSQKYGLNKEISKQFAEVLTGRIGFLINERMLNFPKAIVPISFSSIRDDLDKMKKPFKHILYIQKIRIAEEDKQEDNQSSSQGKKKKGKAEKKRIAAAALAKAEVIFDNAEDSELFKLTEGDEYHFDYPVHQDVEVGSKFHIIEQDGKKYRPYRRAVLMDAKRFKAFVNEMTTFT